ncbi:hypothetical protein [Neobacillus sp. LXY-4]|uniref:hypothetical protein n=1 Tax=Neobacillus sp. LXY-4 TaxID=3379826 RepID=UPI003EE0D74E
MRNLALTNEVISGKVYMVKLAGSEIDSFRVLTETPTHYIFSFSNDESVEVFEKAKKDIVGIYEVKEWVDTEEI